MRQPECELIVAKLVEAYPVPAWTPGGVSLYVEMLLDLDRDICARAVRDLIATDPKRPSIAGIRRGVAEAAALADPRAGYLSPDEAWGVVQEAFGVIGRERPFPDNFPLVAHAVASMGWRTMCDSENLETLRAQFRLAYTALLERSLKRVASSPGAIQLPIMPDPKQSRLSGINELLPSQIKTLLGNP